MFAANQKSRLSLHLTSCQSVASKSQELLLVFCEEQWLSSLKGWELLQRFFFTLSATQGVLHRSLQTTNQITKFLRRIPMNKQQDASLINMCISKRPERMERIEKKTLFNFGKATMEICCYAAEHTKTEVQLLQLSAWLSNTLWIHIPVDVIRENFCYYCQRIFK